MDQYKSSYRDEAQELIAAMETSLLQLEHTPDNEAIIQEVFRAMHTLKGNSAMFGFKVIAEFTHHLESIYEFVRSGQQKITRQILNVSLASLDHLSALVKDDTLSSPDLRRKHQLLTVNVVEVVSAIQQSLGLLSLSDNLETTCDSTSSPEGKKYKICFAPHKDFFYNGSNPLYYIDELKLLGDCSVSLKYDEVPLIGELTEINCFCSWEISLETEADEEQIRAVFQFVEHLCGLEISELNEQKAAPVGELKEQLTDEKVLDKAPEAEAVTTTLAPKKNVISSVRVSSERLDNLMSLVSELITLQAKLGTLAEQLPHSELMAVTENLEKISTRLRDNAFNMCLVPINNMLTPFNRLVRDLAADLNKEINFVTEGAETELDKNIMEGLSDPLMHLLRNSIDHGIEAPDVREQAGKSRCGTIVFKAYCSGTNVFIEIKDDGKGMDPEKIREKAVQKGIIAKDELLSEKEIFNLIFLPGFSTAEKISEISGRGVGMDVVKRKITDIRGQIKIASVPNEGTTITIKLPLTVSIIDGLMVKVNGADFVIPLSLVDRCFELPSLNVLNAYNNVITLDGEQLPYINLCEEFGEPASFATSQELIIVYHDDRKVALVADYVVGKFQAVLKPLGPYFLQMETISGATILGDGQIALVLDTNKIIEQYIDRKRYATCQ